MKSHSPIPFTINAYFKAFFLIRVNDAQRVCESSSSRGVGNRKLPIHIVAEGLEQAVMLPFVSNSSFLLYLLCIFDRTAQIRYYDTGELGVKRCS